MSFFTDFFNISENGGETAVCCPFDHFTVNGIPYKETNPSAHVNTEKKVFNCKVCGAGFSETQFIQHIFDCSYMDAKRLEKAFETNEDIIEWNSITSLSEESKQKGVNLGISPEVLTELNVATPTGTTDLLAFPVFIYGHLIDVRVYNPGCKPKVKSRTGCPSGLIIPYDIWKDTPHNRTTLICAGEKDMAIARSHGFNAITITGGEGASPKLLKEFTNREIAICYDNDGAGIAGAKKLAMLLYKYTTHIKVCTNFHEVCKEKGEDITDFFTKYQKTNKDLINYLKTTEYYTPNEEDLRNNYPIVDLYEASKPDKINKMVRSNIQVIAVSDTTFVTPTAIIAEKFKVAGANDELLPGTTKEWELTENNCQDILHLIDNNFTEDAIKRNTKTILGISPKERCIKLHQYSKKTVFKVVVTDLYETTNPDIQPMEYTAYSLDHKLESGKKYLATYKIAPHPYKGQQLIMIITDVVKANDSISNFKITPEVKEKLKVFTETEGTVSEKIDLFTEKVKSLLGYNGNSTLIQALDLAYHTVLSFDFGSFKNIRGYLDTMIVGESRVGKSSTADTLRKTYELGVFTSLAGNSATVPGLVGGSNKAGSGYQTRAGIIPQNNKGLIIFEEFGKSNANIITELTDIRSSNEVRITRVSGTLTLPAVVRMISLTNVKSTNGEIKPIAAYPNGISILTELIGTAEDIARYDLMLILSDRGNSQVDPFWTAPEPFPKEAYQTRIRWVWSREPENIVISKEVGLYILEQANALNQLYDCHIKIFGTEAWKKISRLAIAIAGYLVSTDESFENIIVTTEHVDYAVEFFKKIYDNPTFKLKEYVTHERRYMEIDDEGIANLQEIYNKSPSIIMQLEQCATASKNMLGAATGLNNDELNKILNRLAKGLFIKFQNHDIIPTQRFRLGVAQIEKNTFVRRIGE